MGPPLRPLALFGLAAPWREWLLLSLCILLSLALALAPGPESARWGVQHLGYWQMLLLLGAAGWFAHRYWLGRKAMYRRWRQRFGGGLWLGPVALVVAASVFAHLQFPHRFKVLTDEAALVGTSLAIQQHRIVYTPNRAESRDGVFVLSTGYINKRPYLHPVLVSLVNDFTGYRWNNSILLNAALTPLVMGLFFLLGRCLARRWGGAAAVLLASGVPIIAQTMTGGGFEVLNLLLLLAATYCGFRLWQRPSVPLLGLFLSLVCLLAYTRYESALYIVPAGLLVWAVLRRWQLGRVPPVLYVVPLLCVPLVWLQSIAFAHEEQYFQLGANHQGSAFSASFFERNLASAVDYFARPNPVNLSSPLVFFAGCLGVVLLGGCLYQVRGGWGGERARSMMVLSGLAVATAGNGLLFLFFAYGQYGAYITQRISVPIWGVAVLLAVWGCGRVRSGWVPVSVLLVGALNLFCFHLPAAGNNFAEHEYVYGKDFAFVADFAERLRGEEGIKVVSHVPIYWLVQRHPVIGPAQAEREELDLLRSLQLAQTNRLLVHFFEYSPYYQVGDGFQSRPPAWFREAKKKLVERRWMGSGTWSVIYEVFPPPAPTAGGAPAAK